MEPTLLVIGLNHRTASLAMRERFWIGERRYEILRELQSADGIEEVVAISTCCRTEFWMWASEPTLASNSILQFLGSSYGLKLAEWEHFYRLLDESALLHLFRVAAGLDSMILGETQIVSQINAAWEQARTVGAAGPFLNAVLDKSLQVSTRVRSETKVGHTGVSIPTAALNVAQQVFGSLAGRRVVLLGRGKASELSVRQLVESGASSLVVIDQSLELAREVTDKIGGTPATLADRWKCMLEADIVISSTGCPHVVITREEAERIAVERNRVALVIVDIAVPRDVDPEVRKVDGILLYDLDGLDRAVRSSAADRITASQDAEKIVSAEAQLFRGKLQAEGAVPTIVALRRRLDEICRQELESFIAERGPFTREQDQSLHAITNQVTRRIASSLVRELKELPEKAEQEQMTAAVTRLFHLDSPSSAGAARSDKNFGGKQNERKQEAVAH